MKTQQKFQSKITSKQELFSKVLGTKTYAVSIASVKH